MRRFSLSPSQLRARLADAGITVSLQAVWAWSRGGGIKPQFLAPVSAALGLSASEAAALYAEQGAPLPACIIAAVEAHEATAATSAE